MWLKFRCMAWVPCIGTLGNLVVVVGIIGLWTFIPSSFKSCLNLSSTKGQCLHSSPTCWQYEWVMASTPKFLLKTSVFWRTCNFSLRRKISLVGQVVCWYIGLCQTIVGTTQSLINSKQGVEID